MCSLSYFHLKPMTVSILFNGEWKAGMGFDKSWKFIIFLFFLCMFDQGVMYMLLKHAHPRICKFYLNVFIMASLELFDWEDMN
ncbi:hypothetical protein VNO77_14899 [Canavalia gladiata]|uniref:Uncharacterized protein n=1 Tax=Canavalia gladiata TaxID=3824 RepID=A0AAN9M3U6_CANGL